MKVVYSDVLEEVEPSSWRGWNSAGNASVFMTSSSICGSGCLYSGAPALLLIYYNARGRDATKGGKAMARRRYDTLELIIGVLAILIVVVFLLRVFVR